MTRINAFAAACLLALLCACVGTQVDRGKCLQSHVVHHVAFFARGGGAGHASGHASAGHATAHATPHVTSHSTPHEGAAPHAMSEHPAARSTSRRSFWPTWFTHSTAKPVPAAPWNETVCDQWEYPRGKGEKAA